MLTKISCLCEELSFTASQLCAKDEKRTFSFESALRDPLSSRTMKHSVFRWEPNTSSLTTVRGYCSNSAPSVSSACPRMNGAASVAWDFKIICCRIVLRRVHFRLAYRSTRISIHGYVCWVFSKLSHVAVVFVFLSSCRFLCDLALRLASSTVTRTVDNPVPFSVTALADLDDADLRDRCQRTRDSDVKSASDPGH